MSRRKLLLADDSITIQKVVNLTFADEGIDVVTVGDGDAALAQLLLDTPDILLADVNMPGPTGYEICERLRANDATKNVPVILLVGSFEPFDEGEASRVGANAYLTKPFQSIKQLIAQVNELIELTSTSAVVDVADEVAASSPSAIESNQEIIEEPVANDASASIEPSPVAFTPPASNAVPHETDATPVPRYFDDLGYETPAPPAETAAEPEPVADDIDSLYAQSISTDELSDVGLDDDMIETSYTAPESAEQIGSFAEVAEAADETPVLVAEPETVDPVAEDPDLPRTETEFGFRSGYDQRFPEDPSKLEDTVSFHNWQPADMREEGAEIPTSYDTTPLNEPGPQPVEEAAPEAPVNPVGEDTIPMASRFDGAASSSYKFEDVDLLDLSGEGTAPVELTSPANAAEQGGSKQVVTLAPELIEMIAQRVVEKLSEKY